MFIDLAKGFNHKAVHTLYSALDEQEASLTLPS